MKQIELIELIEIKLDGSVTILPHPKQAELYGEEDLDADFVESIRLQGVLQPPVITYLKDIADGMLDMIDPAITDPDTIIMVSGHRRWKGSIKAGRETLTCQIKHYDNYFDSEVDHITYNKQRKKTKRVIANEISDYKQKLSQVRKILENEGVEGLEKVKSFDFAKHVKMGEDGKYYLPFATQLIASDLGISEKHQAQYNVIFNDDWLQEKIEAIGVSTLSKKKKAEAEIQFNKLVEDGRAEVDKKDGLSINKVYNEIMRVWNDIDSHINPKSRDVLHTSRKKKVVSKVWTKPKDFIIDKSSKDKPSDLEVPVDGKRLINSTTSDIIFISSDKHDLVFKVDCELLYQFLKEQS